MAEKGLWNAIVTPNLSDVLEMLCLNENLFTQLVEKRLVLHCEIQKLETENSDDRMKKSLLFTYLYTKGDEGFHKFCSALAKSQNDTLLKLLKEKEENISTDVNVTNSPSSAPGSATAIAPSSGRLVSSEPRESFLGSPKRVRVDDDSGFTTNQREMDPPKRSVFHLLLQFKETGLGTSEGLVTVVVVKCGETLNELKKKAQEEGYTKFGNFRPRGSREEYLVIKPSYGREDYELTRRFCVEFERLESGVNCKLELKGTYNPAKSLNFNVTVFSDKGEVEGSSTDVPVSLDPTKPFKEHLRTFIATWRIPIVISLAGGIGCYFLHWRKKLR